MPTPRSSQSPRKSSSLYRTSTDPTTSPLSSPPQSPRRADKNNINTIEITPPTPLSPSKRRANILPMTSDSDLNLSKRNKAILPPFTGLPGTPGQGNLFGNSFKGEPSEKMALEATKRLIVKGSKAEGKENDPSRPDPRT